MADRAGAVLVTPEIVQKSLGLWPGQAGAAVRLINLSENHTFLLEQPDGAKTVLRVHRPGYHSVLDIKSELSWIAALRHEADIATPVAIAGVNGEKVQLLDWGGGEQRFAVLFGFETGAEPEASADLMAPFSQLGVLAAKCHNHAQSWQMPVQFSRLTWDTQTILDRNAHWGDWRQGPSIERATYLVLNRGEAVVRQKLVAYGKSAHRFGLIHADMRLANLLIDGGQTKLIDFDDCGFGWFVYDFAAAISFFEDASYVPDLLESWLGGYTSVRHLEQEDLAAIGPAILLRRFALLAWIGSHHETELAASCAPDFAIRTANLVEHYLTSGSLGT